MQRPIETTPKICLDKKLCELKNRQQSMNNLSLSSEELENGIKQTPLASISTKSSQIANRPTLQIKQMEQNAKYLESRITLPVQPISPRLTKINPVKCEEDITEDIYPQSPHERKEERKLTASESCYCLKSTIKNIKQFPVWFFLCHSHIAGRK